MDKRTEKILLAEDDVKTREYLKQSLIQKGYNVDTVNTGKQVLEKINTKFYNLAIISQTFSDINGMKFVAKIHRMGYRGLIFIIGSVSLDDAVNAINQGADAYIMRPVNLEKLLKMVREKLDKQRRKNVKKTINVDKRSKML